MSIMSQKEFQRQVDEIKAIGEKNGVFDSQPLWQTLKMAERAFYNGDVREAERLLDKARSESKPVRQDYTHMYESKNILNEWHRIAFGKGSRSLNEGRGEDPGLSQLKPMGFFFAGTGSVVLGDLDEMSGKDYQYEYPCDDPYEQGAFHVQVSVQEDGTYAIHDYTSVEPEFVSHWPLTGRPKIGRGNGSGFKFDTIEEVQQAIRDMVVAYDEFMEVYQQVREMGTIVDDYWPAIDVHHPENQKFKKH